MELTHGCTHLFEPASQTFVVARAEPLTLAADLEQDRLRHRAARLDRVVTALRSRARSYDARAIPDPLSHSLTDFRRELVAVQARLAASPADRPGAGRHD